MTQEIKEKIAKQYAWSHSTLGIDKTTFQSEDTHMISPYQMVRVPIYNSMERAVMFGLSYAEKNIWKPADGDDLPELDREVIVLIGKYNEVRYAHRPNPDRNSIETDDEEDCTDTKTYDKGGWNIRDVRWWLDAELPNTNES